MDLNKLRSIPGMTDDKIEGLQKLDNNQKIKLGISILIANIYRLEKDIQLDLIIVIIEYLSLLGKYDLLKVLVKDTAQDGPMSVTELKIGTLACLDNLNKVQSKLQLYATLLKDLPQGTTPNVK